MGGISSGSSPAIPSSSLVMVQVARGLKLPLPLLLLLLLPKPLLPLLPLLLEGGQTSLPTGNIK